MHEPPQARDRAAYVGLDTDRAAQKDGAGPPTQLAEGPDEGTVRSLRIYVARHAKAIKRARWDGPDELRGLTDAGWRQAHGIVRMLDAAPVGRVVTSPALRCRQTVDPFASVRGLRPQIDERLAEGTPSRRVLELVNELESWPVLLCSHGDVIPRLLENLLSNGLEISAPLVCEKGSIWVLEGKRTLRRAHYRAPIETDARAETAELSAAQKKRSFNPPVRVAVLDLGSTSFHLLVADAISGGEIKRVMRERVMLRLGSSSGVSAQIPDEVAARALETARQLREEAEAANAECLFPVATSAVRDAENGAELAEELGDALGVPVRVLCGREEARLIFAAYRQRLGLGSEIVLGADLGGGSLELMAGNGERLAFDATLKLGVARLHGELVDKDPLTRAAAEAVRARVNELLTPHLASIGSVGGGRCIASGGTIGALARLILARRDANGSRPAGRVEISLAELENLTERLVVSTHDERLAMPAMDVRRADLLPTGAIIMTTLARVLRLEGFTVCDWGLREGVILEALGLAAAASQAPD